jgi:[acyl-carrier-protein] S-malonyltransferase
MAKEASSASPKAAALLEQADRIMGFPLSRMMFEGPEEKLKETSITQPALFLASAAALELVKERGIKPEWVAGHSVGEYAALYAAGVLGFENALRLVRARGEAMHEATQQTKGTMAAIIGLDSARLTEICVLVSQNGEVCAPANFNSGSQTVIAGTEKAVLMAMEKAKEAGAAKTVQLNVAGAFHSPLMSGAAQKMKTIIESTPFSKAITPVVTNVDAQLTIDPDEFKRKLSQQIDHPVRWEESLKKLIAGGTDAFIEVGAGTVLSSMAKRLDRQKLVYATDDMPSIDKDFSLIADKN